MIEFAWFERGDIWVPELLWMTLGLGSTLAIAAVCRRIRTAPRIWRGFWGLVFWVVAICLALFWPVTTVYVFWVAALATGTQRYLQVKRGWTLGLAAGVISLLILAVLVNRFHLPL